MKELTRDYDIVNEMAEPLIITNLIRGVPIQEIFSGGAGSYGSRDPSEYVEFMEVLMQGIYPIEEYVVHGFASINVELKTSNDTRENILINADIAFRVSWLTVGVRQPPFGTFTLKITRMLGAQRDQALLIL